MTDNFVGLDNSMRVDLLMLCIQVSEETKADAFFRYSPHVDQVFIDVHEDGWVSGVDSGFSVSFGGYAEDGVKCGYEYTRNYLEGILDRKDG